MIALSEKFIPIACFAFPGDLMHLSRREKKTLLRLTLFILIALCSLIHGCWWLLAIQERCRFAILTKQLGRWWHEIIIFLREDIFEYLHTTAERKRCRKAKKNSWMGSVFYWRNARARSDRTAILPVGGLYSNVGMFNFSLLVHCPVYKQLEITPGDLPRIVACEMSPLHSIYYPFCVLDPVLVLADLVA